MISHAFAQEKSASISNGSAQSETDGHYRRLSHSLGADDWLKVDPNMGQNIIPSYWFCWVSIARHRIFARWSILTYFDLYPFCHNRSRGYRFGSFAKIFRVCQDLGLLFVWLRHWAVLWEKVRGLLGRLGMIRMTFLVSMFEIRWAGDYSRVHFHQRLQDIGWYPLVNIQKAIEHGHLCREFSH